MSTQSLTAKYRPQRFADVAGQEAIKAILSRAAAEDRVAPAYLFSGTRGVGKTTIARILAKALNCATAPTPEPCCECSSCRQIVAGSAVDVIEIDAASNRGVEDARRLKEDVGYAPLEGRYKIFIIDEAHMLTREASNALLKTLEEPPSRVCFILATTEPEKILQTIISRCQHYTFKRLPQKGLVDHLTRLLDAEGVEYENAAVDLIARRGAGSVRDAMSLLGQVLALGAESLTAEDARSVLGLAGADVFFSILGAVADGDCAAIARLLEEVLDGGLDLGFFMRELSAAWRSLFLLKQSGPDAWPLIGAPESEREQWLALAERFELAHVHACWQLSLEGQRTVMKSLEPALDLELLLFNLASLPQLYTVAGTPAMPGGGAAQTAAQKKSPRANG